MGTLLVVLFIACVAAVMWLGYEFGYLVYLAYVEGHAEPDYHPINDAYEEGYCYSCGRYTCCCDENTNALEYDDAYVPAATPNNITPFPLGNNEIVEIQKRFLRNQIKSATTLQELIALRDILNEQERAGVLGEELGLRIVQRAIDRILELEDDLREYTLAELAKVV